MPATEQSAPKLRDAERTKARLLSCARQVFVRKGYDGATVDVIARQAGTSKNMIYHYFGNKENLYIEVMEAELKALRHSQADLRIRHLDPLDAIEKLTVSTFDYFSRNRSTIKILNIENLQQGRSINRSPAAIKAYEPLIDSIDCILKRGVAEKKFRSGIDPLGLYLSIAGMCYHFISNSYTLGAVFKRDFSSAAEIARRREQIVDFVLAAVRP